MEFPKISRIRTSDAFREHVATLGVELPYDDTVEPAPEGPLAQPIDFDGWRIGNRFSVLPMEGWDGSSDGRPTELTTRRWRRFGESGAKLIWGGEAVAVRHDGRANPNQLVLTEANVAAIAALRETLEAAHRERFETTDDLLIGLQLTHSGRYARPNGREKAEPRVAYRHPYLDRRVGVGVDADATVFTDDELDTLAADFVAAARRASDAGFRFVDFKHCHGYLGHELLSGYDRPGRYGGDFAGRTRFLRDVIAGIGAVTPDLRVGVRLSVFDFAPFKPGPDGVGIAESAGEAYPFAFGGDGSGVGVDLTEPIRLIGLLRELGVRLVCTTAGSPYYNPHVQRPAAFPPSDGYAPPEDPLVGVARQIEATGRIKREHPDAIVVGSGYSYLQEHLPNVAQRVVGDGLADAVGLGRMVLSYPDLPADVLRGVPLARKKICRTFSDCTTAPRNGLVSGCFPLDRFYKEHPDRERLAAATRRGK